MSKFKFFDNYERKKQKIARKEKKRRRKQIKQSSDKGWQRRDSGGKTFVM